MATASYAAGRSAGAVAPGVRPGGDHGIRRTPGWLRCLEDCVWHCVANYPSLGYSGVDIEAKVIMNARGMGLSGHRHS